MNQLNELRRKRAGILQEMRDITAKEAADDAAPLEQSDLDRFSLLETEVAKLDGRISRLEAIAAREANDAVEVEAGDGDGDGDDPGEVQARGRVPSHGRKGGSVPARPEVKLAPGIVIGGIVRMMAASGGQVTIARDVAKDLYGERHPVVKALQVGVGAAGGFTVPPDYVAELIELLRAKTVVRKAGTRVLPMPRGTLTMPRQSQAATAGYGAELTAIPVSQQAADQIVATYKKLTALVPVSNDLLRYSDPAFDAIVRDDLVQVFARREDLAFVRGDGTNDSPRGFLNFALAGAFVTANPAYTYATAASELGGAINVVESANVPMDNCGWIMPPRVKNYLLNVQNTVGAYIYKDEMVGQKTLLSYPFYTTTQIPTNLVVGANNDCSEIYFVDFSQDMIFDSMTLELSVSREASYVDANNNTVNTFQSDQTLVRGISEHDHQMRHNEAIAVITGVRWAPGIL